MKRLFCISLVFIQIIHTMDVAPIEQSSHKKPICQEIAHQAIIDKWNQHAIDILEIKPEEFLLYYEALPTRNLRAELFRKAYLLRFGLGNEKIDTVLATAGHSTCDEHERTLVELLPDDDPYKKSIEATRPKYFKRINPLFFNLSEQQDIFYYYSIIDSLLSGNSELFSFHLNCHKIQQKSILEHIRYLAEKKGQSYALITQQKLQSPSPSKSTPPLLSKNLKSHSFHGMSSISRSNSEEKQTVQHPPLSRSSSGKLSHVVYGMSSISRSNSEEKQTEQQAPPLSRSSSGKLSHVVSGLVNRIFSRSSSEHENPTMSSSSDSKKP